MPVLRPVSGGTKSNLRGSKEMCARLRALPRRKSARPWRFVLLEGSRKKQRERARQWVEEQVCGRKRKRKKECWSTYRRGSAAQKHWKGGNHDRLERSLIFAVRDSHSDGAYLGEQKEKKILEGKKRQGTFLTLKRRLQALAGISHS